MEKFKIDIESQGTYEMKKEFNHLAELDTRQYLGLVSIILDYLDTLPENKITTKKEEK